jgi:CHAD domain-containing protein
MAARIDTRRQHSTASGADRPVRELAVRTIRRRLVAVWRELDRACVDRGDPEAIHRLRVASRRAIAAIDAFATLVPGGCRRWFRRRLRDLRRAAGDARDLDVLADRLSGDVPPVPASAARRRLIAMLSRQRPLARRPVVEARERLVAAGWLERVTHLVDHVAAGRVNPSAREFSRKRLKRVARRFFERADRGVRRGAELHRLRIDGKRLRYTLEIFAPWLAADHRRRCEKTLEALQEELGRYTDHEAVADRLRRWSDRPVVEADRRLLESIGRAEHDAAARARRQFVKWWTRSRRRTLRRCFRRAFRKDSA